VSLTTKGYPYPQPSDEADVPADMQLLADVIDAAPGVASFTQTQINALSVADKWAGRLVWNQTTFTHQQCDGSVFTDLATTTAAILKTLVNAKGDLLAGTADNLVDRLALGTDGHVLTSDPSTSTGMKWAAASAGATGAGNDRVFALNDQVVTSNYSIPTGKNALTVSPISINSGITVTIPTGSVWKVI
jgi:hypothetical protein